jgi:large subunit ribosomal protein L25
MAKTKKTTKEKIELVAEPRDVFGKKLRNFRYKGLIPANIFGADFQSKAITITLANFTAAHKVAHETGVVYVKLGDEEIPTLIRTVQHHPVDNHILHVDFRKINLKQKIETTVPVEIVGESIAVNQLGGVLLTQTDHVTVEALPQNIPSTIQVDISKLTEVGTDIKVSDLPKSAEYEIKEDPEKVIISITEHKEESVTPETEAAQPEITTEKAPAEGEEVPGEAEPAETKE